MTRRSSKPAREGRCAPRAFAARLSIAHKEIWAAYRNALDVTGCTQARAGRGMGVSSATAANYEHQITPVKTARVLAFPLLRGPFLRFLCGEHHDDHAPAPYIARKRKRSR